MKKIIFLLLLAGCNPDVVTKVTPVNNPREAKGLGISYNWPGKDYTLLCEALAKSGCNITDIEYMGSTVSIKHGYRPGGADALKDDYLALLKECRKRNLTLFVSIVNDNMHIKKWGQSGVHDISHFPQECERAAQIVLEAGPANVIVQPVAETQTSRGRDYETRWLKTFNQAGFKTCYNRGSRPTSNGGAWTRAYHSCKLSDLGNGSNILLIPDCGTAIDAYTDANDEPAVLDLYLDGPLYTGGNFNTGTIINPNTAADFVRRGRAKGNGVCIYTGTGIKSVEDQIPAIKAIGAVQ